LQLLKVFLDVVPVNRISDFEKFLYTYVDNSLVFSGFFNTMLVNFDETKFKVIIYLIVKAYLEQNI